MQQLTVVELEHMRSSSTAQLFPAVTIVELRKIRANIVAEPHTSCHFLMMLTLNKLQKAFPPERSPRVVLQTARLK